MSYPGGGVVANATIYAVSWEAPDRYPAGQDGSRSLSVMSQCAGTPSVRFGEDLPDPSPPPLTSPGPTVVESEVGKVLSVRGMHKAPDDIYLVLTADHPSNLTTSGFCGWHSSSACGTPLSFADLPNAADVSGWQSAEMAPPGTSGCSLATRSRPAEWCHFLTEGPQRCGHPGISPWRKRPPVSAGA